MVRLRVVMMRTLPLGKRARDMTMTTMTKRKKTKAKTMSQLPGVVFTPGYRNFALAPAKGRERLRPFPGPRTTLVMELCLYK